MIVNNPLFKCIRLQQCPRAPPRPLLQLPHIVQTTDGNSACLLFSYVVISSIYSLSHSWLIQLELPPELHTSVECSVARDTCWSWWGCGWWWWTYGNISVTPYSSLLVGLLLLAKSTTELFHLNWLIKLLSLTLPSPCVPLRYSADTQTGNNASGGRSRLITPLPPVDGLFTKY